MAISSRFTVGIHILALVYLCEENIATSRSIAASVHTNPTLIRKIIGMMKKADLIEVEHGKAGAKLKKDPSEISLLEVYCAVEAVPEKGLFNVHEHPDQKCPVGKHIQNSLAPYLDEVQLALEKKLADFKLSDVISDIAEKEKLDLSHLGAFAEA